MTVTRNSKDVCGPRHERAGQEQQIDLDMTTHALRANAALSIPRAGSTSILSRIVVGTFLIASTLNVIPFAIWESAVQFTYLDPYFYLIELSFEEIFFDPWGLRSGLVMPALLLAEFTPLDHDQAFGLTAGLCIVGTARLVQRTYTVCVRPKETRHELPIMLLFLFLGYFMHGRICYAFLGVAVLLRAHSFWLAGKMEAEKVVFYNMLGLLLLTASTGAFFIGCGMVGTWTMFAVLNIRRNNAAITVQPWPLLLSLPVAYFIYFQSELFLEKLMRWHGGDYMMLLYHGQGTAMKQYLPFLDFGMLLAVAPLVALVVGVFWFSIVRLRPAAGYLLTVISIGAVMGLCGDSTAATSLPVAAYTALVMVQGRKINTGIVKRSAAELAAA
jgi:hypothetical protein